MTEFITNNYPIIIIVAAFLIFALIGFAVDSSKNKKNNISEENLKPESTETSMDVQEDSQIETEVSEENLEENNIPEIDNLDSKD